MPGNIFGSLAFYPCFIINFVYCLSYHFFLTNSYFLLSILP